MTTALGQIVPLLRRAAAGNGRVAVVILLLGVAVHLNALPGDFIGDDEAIVRDNPLVVSPSLRGIFTTNYWWGKGFVDNLYRPLTILTYAVNRLVFGPGALSFHAVNILLHGAVSALLFLFVASLGRGRAIAFCAAALFAVHPIHGEAVNVIVGRADLLAAFFCLAALAVDARPGKARNWAVPLCLGGALLSKESGVALVALVPLADAFRGGSIAGSLRRRGKFFLLLALLAALWLPVVQLVLFPGRWGHHSTPYDNPLIALGPGERFLPALKMQILYLREILVPYRLGLVYGTHDLQSMNAWFPPQGVSVALFWAVLAGAAIAAWRRGSAFGLALPFYAAAAVPTANLLVPIAVVMAERLAYLPSAAVCIALATAVAGLAARGRALRGAASCLALVAPAALLCYGASLAWTTLARNPDFADPVRLSRAIVAAKPGSGRGWYSLGLELNKRGETAEALRSLEAGVAADPEYPELWYALAVLEIGAGRAEQGYSHAQRYLALSPDSLKINTIVARALVDLGRPGEAMAWLDKVEPLIPEDPVLLWTRGMALEALGRGEEAEARYTKVLELTDDPGFVSRHAAALLRAGEPERAERALRLALRRWNLPEHRRLLGAVLAAQAMP